MGKRSIIVTNAPKGIWPFTQGQLIYEPVAIAFVAVLAYFVGVALGAAWAAIPLTPTIVSTATEPASPEASFTQSLIGNLAAILIAFVTIRAIGLEHGEATDLLVTFSPLRAIGILAALLITPMACTIFGIVQPSAAATAAIIVFFGVTPTPHVALSLTIEVVLVAFLGEIMRRWRAKGAPVR